MKVFSRISGRLQVAVELHRIYLLRFVEQCRFNLERVKETGIQELLKKAFTGSLELLGSFLFQDKKNKAIKVIKKVEIERFQKVL